MKKRVIVACGGAVATSTIAAHRISEICKKQQIDVEICQMKISEIASHLDGVDLIVTTSKISKDYGIPYVMGLPFLTGIGEKETEDAIVQVLKRENPG